MPTESQHPLALLEALLWQMTRDRPSTGDLLPNRAGDERRAKAELIQGYIDTLEPAIAALRAQAEAGMCRTCRHWVPFTENLEMGGCSLLNHAEGTKLAYLNIAGAGAFPEGYACITTRPEFGCTHWEARATLAQAGGEG